MEWDDSIQVLRGMKEERVKAKGQILGREFVKLKQRRGRETD